MKKISKIILFILLCFISLEAATYFAYFLNGSRMKQRSELKKLLTIKESNDKKVLGEMTDLPKWTNEDVVHPYLGYVYDFDKKNNIDNFPINKYGFTGDNPILKKGENKIIIGIFGGSVAEIFTNNMKSDLTKKLKTIPAFKNKDIKILNLALSGYKQPQQLIALNYFLTLGAEFDIVINIDGFNEATLGYSLNMANNVNPLFPKYWDIYSKKTFNKDSTLKMAQISKIRQEKEHAKFLLSSTFLKQSFFALTIWDLFNKYEDRRIFSQKELLNNVLGANTYQGSGPVLELNDDDSIKYIVRAWTNASIQMSNIAKSNDILYLHFLQPNQYFPHSKKLTTEELSNAYLTEDYWKKPVEKIYPQFLKNSELLKNKGVKFYDLTMLFQDNNNTIYIDSCCHINDYGNSLLEAKIASTIAENYVN